MNTSQTRILIVDDDPSLQELMEMLLITKDYTVSKACNGQEAMSIVEQESFDLIILDLMMPVMDGMAFLKWLRQTFKSTTSVAMLTAVIQSERVDELLDAGANGVLNKPIDTDRFLDQIEKLLGETDCSTTSFPSTSSHKAV